MPCPVHIQKGVLWRYFMEDTNEDITRLEKICKKINESKCSKVAFKLPLKSDDEYYGLLSLAESYAGYRAVKVADNKYIFELDRKNALRYLEVCIRGIKLLPENPIKQIELEELVEYADGAHDAQSQATQERADGFKKTPLPDIKGGSVYCMTRKQKPS